MTAPGRRYGFLMAEVIVGIGLMALVMTLLAVGAARHFRASQRLSDSRAAALLAEQTLTALQSGGVMPADNKAKVVVKRLDVSSNARGLIWATVDAQVNGRTASLTGLIRADAKDAGGTP